MSLFATKVKVGMSISNEIIDCDPSEKVPIEQLHTLAEILAKRLSKIKNSTFRRKWNQYTRDQEAIKQLKNTIILQNDKIEFLETRIKELKTTQKNYCEKTN